MGNGRIIATTVGTEKRGRSKKRELKEGDMEMETVKPATHYTVRRDATRLSPTDRRVVCGTS